MKTTISKRKNVIIVGFGISLVVIAIVLLIVFLLHGQVTISGEFPGDETEESLVCERQDAGFFLFEDSRILSDSTKLTLIFSSTNLRLASLIYSATTASNTAAQNIEAVMMSELNKSFGKEYGFNGLGANFISDGNTARMSLTANASEIGTNGRKYFLIDGIIDYKDNYYEELTRRGFNCKRINS